MTKINVCVLKLTVGSLEATQSFEMSIQGPEITKQVEYFPTNWLLVVKFNIKGLILKQIRVENGKLEFFSKKNFDFEGLLGRFQI